MYDEVFGLSEEEQTTKREADYKLREALNDEARFWSQRAQRRWREEGDRCTSFFHKIVNARNGKKNIDGLIIEGRWENNEKVCRDHMKEFYEELYTKK